MSRYGPVEYIAKNKIIEGLIVDYSVDYEYRSDLLQEIYMILLELDQSLLQNLIDKKQIRFYIARILRNQFYSKTSKFYKTYKYPILHKETLKTILDNEDPQEDSYD